MVISLTDMLFYKIKEFYRRLISEEWNIGFVNNLDDLLSQEHLNIQWMKHSYTKGWFADPFILRITDSEIFVLVEEFQHMKQCGCISKLIVDRQTMRLKCVKEILKLNTHLSFPAIYRYNNEIYIYPENCVTGRLQIYHYDEETDIVEPIHIWCKEPLVDATLYMDGDLPFLLATKQPFQNGKSLDVYIASGNSPLKWCFEYKQTINFNDNIARNAGLPFIYKGKTLRPAQNCNGGYGKGIVLQELTVTCSDIVLKEIKRFFHLLKNGMMVYILLIIIME